MQSQTHFWRFNPSRSSHDKIAYRAYSEHQWRRSGIARLYWDVPISSVARSMQSQSSYLWGTTGTGKTCTAAKIAQLKIQENTFILGKDRFYTRFRACLIGATQLLENLRNSYEHKGMTEAELLGFYATCDLLILDDLGIEPLSDWGLSRLYDVIDRRYSARKQTIFTSNYFLGELYERLGAKQSARAIVSRIAEMVGANSLQLQGKDRRLAVNA